MIVTHSLSLGRSSDILTILKTKFNNYRFEKDLLDRAEEAARSSKDVLVGIGSGVTLSRDSKITRRSDSHSDDDEWQSDHVFDSIASDSPRRGTRKF